jgi:biopolymer transport protein ExbD
MVETKGRSVRQTDKYGVAGELIRARAENPRALVVMKADQDASFGTMKAIMKQMQENHLERFLIITDNEVETSMEEEAES